MGKGWAAGREEAPLARSTDFPGDGKPSRIPGHRRRLPGMVGEVSQQEAEAGMEKRGEASLQQDRGAEVRRGRMAAQGQHSWRSGQCAPHRGPLSPHLQNADLGIDA